MKTTGDAFVDVPAKILAAWLDACRCQMRAQRERTRKTWKSAAKAWDALTRMHSPMEADRMIYRSLAVQAWQRVAHWREA
jgi:hypothetical protein